MKLQNESQNYINDSGRTESIEDTPVNTVFVIFAWFVSGWVVISNMFLVMCTLVSRKKQWSIFTRMLLNLNICDVSVGLSCILVYSIHAMKSRSGIKCNAVFYVFFWTHMASLFSTFGICLHRSFGLTATMRTGVEAG